MRINDKNVKRAGLDYWDLLDVTVWESLDDFLAANGDKKDSFYFATTKTDKPYFEVEFKKDDFIFLVESQLDFQWS